MITKLRIDVLMIKTNYSIIKPILYYQFLNNLKKINDYNFLFSITSHQCTITSFSTKIVYKSI